MKTYIVKFTTDYNERTMRMMNCNNENHAKVKLCEYIIKKENLVPTITSVYQEQNSDVFNIFNKIFNGSL